MARRKKLQKAFALLLTFSMLMSLLSVTALAAVPVVPDVPETHTRTCTTCMGSGTVEPYDCLDCEDGTVSCPDCDGTLQVDCTACEGGKIACGECTDGKVQTDTICSVCGGEGGTETDDGSTVECTACRDTGYQWKNCEACGGTGEVDCEACAGAGKVGCETCGKTGSITCPTCKGDTTLTVCKDCGGEGKVACTGAYEIDMEQTKATCAKSGRAVYVCSVCDGEFVQSNVILDHEPTTVTTTTSPTCTEEGVETCYCEICDDSYTRSIPALGHEYGEDGRCTHDGCSETAFSVGATFKVDDCWEEYNNKPSFDTFALICTVTAAPDENGENGEVAVTGWAGAEGNTSSTGVYILIPPTVTDDYGNEYTITEVTANFQKNQSNQQKGKLLGFYLKAPEVKELTVNSMFLGQSNMKVLDLGNSLEVIGVGCFSGCKKIDSTYAVVLPETLKEIGVGAFKNVPFSGKNNYTIDIPDSVTYIGTGAFEGSNLKTVTGGEGITKLESTVFQDCWLLKTVDFPNVTEFESAVFFDSGLTTVGWDWSKVTTLDSDTFGNCYGLTGALKLNGNCELGWSTFAGTGFSSVTIGEGMTEIPNWAFSGCFNLTEINLPNSITSIGQEAFAWVGNGANVKVNIGTGTDSQLTSVGANAFGGGTYQITVAASEDAIDGAANLMGSGNEVTFTGGSLETSQDADALQDLIDAAAGTDDPADDTITLTEGYEIDQTITIPAGANITLLGGETAVALKSALNSGYMFTVPASSSLTLGAGLTCAAGDDLLVRSEGAFILDGAAVSGGKVSGKEQGVVHIAGGSFAMKSGSISGATVNSQYAGTVLLSEGTAMTMTGGTISGNTAEGQLNSGAGVTVCQGATFTMTGGTISGNKAFRGGGVLVFGGTQSGTYTETPATFIMTGGTISGNTATGYLGDLRAAGGGVYVQNNAVFTMEGGTISGNTTDHQGGGVATQDENGDGGVFTMTGGTISGNEAVNGGGVYSYSKAVELLSGSIENNTASDLGGGMYVSTNPYSIQLGDALITGNSATTMGGGIWSCPIGTIDFADGHFAIYDNEAGGAGDDVAALNKVSTTITTLGSNMPGGGVMAWYKDGSISALSMDGNDLGAISGSSVRYDEDDARVTAPTNSRSAFSAKALVTAEAAALAKASADLIITGNQAAQGGGIGSNGIVTLPGGGVNTDQLTVNKTWVDDNNPDRPASVTVELLMDGKAVDSVKLNAANGWKHTFTYVPQGDAQYTVREMIPTGYTAAYSTDANGVVTITNTLIEEETEELPVRKVWAGAANPDRPASVTVELLENGVAVNRMELNAENGWTGTFEYVPEENAAYSVREVVPAGYTATYSTDADGVVTITNTFSDGGDEGEDPDDDPPIEWPDRDPDRDPDTDLPDEDTPTTDLPDQETPTTDVPDEETPTTEQPATELPDEETPLAEVPETGDLSALWLALSALSGTGLAGVTFLGRKKRDEE